MTQIKQTNDFTGIKNGDITKGIAIKFLEDKHIVVEEEERFYRIRTLRGVGWHFSMGEMAAIHKLGTIRLIEVNQEGKWEGLVVIVDKEGAQ